MKLLTAPNFLDPDEFSSSVKVFLGGSIESGSAINWQDDIISEFNGYDVTFLNPRRPTWTDLSNEALQQQVNWELFHQKTADVLIYYFADGTISPVTLFEVGLFSNNGTPMFVYASEKYFRQLNLKFSNEFFNETLYEFFDDKDAFKQHLHNFLKSYKTV